MFLLMIEDVCLLPYVRAFRFQMVRAWNLSYDDVEL